MMKKEGKAMPMFCIDLIDPRETVTVTGYTVEKYDNITSIVE